MLKTENKTRILIVEHDQYDIDSLLRELNNTNFKFEYQIARNEKAFMKSLKTFKPELILSDYSIPGFGGVAAFEIKQKTAPLIPFILVSGTIGEEKAVELIKRGVTDYALKDKLFSLIPKIKRALHEVRELEIKHRTKNELLLSESTLRKAQEIAHIGSWRTELATGIGVWSDEKCRIFGLSPDANIQLTGTFISYVHPDDVDFVRNKLKESETNMGDTSFYCRIINKDGTIKDIYTESRYEINNDGDPVSTYGIVQDITERKRVEKELDNQHSKLLFHVENSPLGFIEWDKNLQVISWSERAKEIFGWTEKECIDEHINGYVSTFEDDKPFVVTIAKELLSGKVIRNTAQHRNYTKDGRVIWCEWFNSAEIDKDGKVVTIMSLVQDITERKNAEKELIVNNAELKKINSELDRFVYSISHELRSPLTALMGLFALFKTENMEEGNKELLNFSNKSVFKMDETLKEILEYSRNSRLEVNNEKIELKKFIDDAFKNTVYFNSDFYFYKRIKIDSEIPFYSDPRRIKVIINNLISNAQKYGKKDNPDSFIEINVVVDEDKLILEIKDNGIGIKKENLPNLFGMFYRATILASGTGLGLYIAKECAEKLGGTIKVESEFGKGTAFTIEIPNSKPKED